MHDWGPAEASSLVLPAARAGDGGAAARKKRRHVLTDIIAAEILPRLTLRAAAAERGSATAPLAPVSPDTLARLAVAGRLDEARAALAARVEAGASAFDLMREDIAPAARRLGELWAGDDCDFFEVTFATRALTLLMREMAPPRANRVAPAAPSLLVSPAPGETHTFAAEMVAGMFRLAGWRAHCCEAEAARAAVAEQWFDVAAYSLSCERFAPRLALAIRGARAVSQNPHVAILVGGPVFANHPGLARSVGAHFCAPKGDLGANYPRTIQKAIRL